MGKYAEGTNVSAEQSIMEIQRTLMRYRAKGFQYGFEDSRAFIGFKIRTGGSEEEPELRIVKMLMTLPEPDDEEFKRTPEKRLWRTAEQAEKAWEQACRQRWRALALAVKSKLESVESGIETFEEAFFAHIVVPGQGGRTFGEIMLPDLPKILNTGKLPNLLPE